MHEGRGPGLTARKLGEKTGVKEVTLTEAQIPSHSHSAGVTDDVGSPKPSNQLFGLADKNYVAAANLGSLASQAVQAVGDGQAHYNMQPFLVLNYIIALQGLYPPRD